MTPTFPIKNLRDAGEGLTVGLLAKMVGDSLDQYGEDAANACEILDREFIFGAWGHLLDPKRNKDAQVVLLNSDIRGLVVAAYRLGKKRGSLR